MGQSCCRLTVITQGGRTSQGNTLAIICAMSGVFQRHSDSEMLSYRGLEWSGLYHVRSVTRTLRQRDPELPRTRVEWVVSCQECYKNTQTARC
ncbi:hypothetical protein RRG08_024993 [Elysia crispata]|uniref:Uncharacterized protein n=1 Tax=Elysia crispata TaxID=231223 RepID=A0AAE1BE68_9GAST|nr:hypothetical protein RRG08_024993 [Elysia crispata]